MKCKNQTAKLMGENLSITFLCITFKYMLYHNSNAWGAVIDCGLQMYEQ